MIRGVIKRMRRIGDLNMISRRFSLEDKEKKRDRRAQEIRIRLEKFADWLAEGDPYEEETMPEVYKSSIEEYKAVQKAIAETEAEENYLDQRREQIYADVEQDRLEHFDNMLGTNTYFRNVGAFEERMSVNSILQRRTIRAKNNIFETNMDDLTLETGTESSLIDFLRPDEESLKMIEKEINAPLRPFELKTISECGIGEIDHYGYLNPAMMSTHMMQKVTDFMFNQSTFFDFKVSEGNSILPRLQREVKKAQKLSGFEENILVFGNKFSYQFDTNKRILFKDAEEEVTSAEELREFFFNFNDQTSFQLCRFLKNNEISKENILGFKFCKEERYLITSLKIGSRFLMVIKDITSGLYCGYYLVSEHPINLEIVYRDANNPEIYSLLPDEFGPNRVLVKANLNDENTYIDHRLKEEEISSVVKYFKDNSENLFDNERVLLDKLKEVWRCPNTERVVEISNSDESLMIEEFGEKKYNCYVMDFSENSINAIYLGNELKKFILSNGDLFARVQENEFEGLYKVGEEIREYNDEEIAENGERVFDGFLVKESIVLKEWIVGVKSHNSNDSLLVKNRKTGETREIEFERRARLELGVNPLHNQSCVTVIQKFINKPRIYSKIDLETLELDNILEEGSMNLPRRSNIVTQRYDQETDQLSIDFVFNENSINPDSPLLLWLSDRKDFDSLNTSLVPLINRDFIICFVSVKEQRNINIKSLLEELKSLSFEFAVEHNKEKIGIVGEGPMSGLLALSTFVKNQAIFESGVFVSPICDLLTFLRERKDSSNFGYGDLEEEEVYESILGDSPYHMEEIKFMKNSLFISHNHQSGFHSLKLFAKGHQIFQKNSNNFWKFTKGDPTEDQLMWITFLVKNFYHSNKRKRVARFDGEVDTEEDDLL